MKTKNKLIALVEIAIVLCSLFLVAIPTIAAQEQNQAMQTVGVSKVTTTSEDEYVLGIYGNANEDDTIDMGDVVYTKLAIFGKKPKTELCDAKYDGRINVLDVIQTKLIILGKEKELTIVDSKDRIVTVKKPIKRIVPLATYYVETVRTLKAKDRIVGITDITKKETLYFPEISKLPSTGEYPYDAEAILSLNPDLVIVGPWSCTKLAEKLPDNINLVCLYLYRPDCFVEEIKKVGYILDKEEEAEEFIDFYQAWMDNINERIVGLSQEDKPKVYLEGGKSYHTFGGGTSYDKKLTTAGGNNIFSDLSGSLDVDPEEVMMRNPEIIVKKPYSLLEYHLDGYHLDETTKLEELRDEMMGRVELQNVPAMKKGKVYVLTNCIIGDTRHFIGIGYMAKWFHPELFKDLDPTAIHQEYLTRFQGLDYNLDEHGVFVYHPEEHPDGK